MAAHKIDFQGRMRVCAECGEHWEEDDVQPCQHCNCDFTRIALITCGMCNETFMGYSCMEQCHLCGFMPGTGNCPVCGQILLLGDMLYDATCPACGHNQNSNPPAG